ncbi:hypothetical protein BBJ28_00006900 [Nothophytophthora sp. Chile5]|nr:hypothetical protein BBJ28_00006900 [Nothophytophthora sp. Chile5]
MLRGHDASATASYAVAPARAHALLAPRVPAVAALAAAKRAPYRRKKLQWRSRDAHSSQLYNLELDLNDLRQQIQQLQQLQQVLQSRVFNRRDALDGYYVKTVQEYHRVFEHGYHPAAAIDAAQYVMQVMDENVAIGRFAGRDVMLHQWERYTRALSGLEFYFLSSRVVSAGGRTIVTSNASYKHLITRDTLQLMFPRALSEYPHIVAKLLGRTFYGVGQFDFTFDTGSHLVVSFDFQLDFLDVFARMLEDPDELCAFFQGARISEEFLIGDVECYEQRQQQQSPERDNTDNMSVEGTVEDSHKGIAPKPVSALPDCSLLANDQTLDWSSQEKDEGFPQLALSITDKLGLDHILNGLDNDNNQTIHE